MPRSRRPLTGRVERRRRLNRINIPPLNTVSQPSVLIDSYKCALSSIPLNFISFELGQMLLRCSHCGAKHFKFEMTQRENDSFSTCCHKGKVILPALTPNAFFESLCTDFSSENPILKRRSLNYLQNIRSFNAAFAMVSSEAKVADTTLRGIYHFKIHDIFYHRAGSLSHSSVRSPRYAQLYFYDVETAVRYRMGEQSNSACDSIVMRSVAEELERVNPFVNSFMTMGEYCRQPQNAASDIHMLIRVNNSVDVRRFNDAVQTDVAAIFASDDGAPPFDRNMVVFSKNSNAVRIISVLDSSLDPINVGFFYIFFPH